MDAFYNGVISQQPLPQQSLIDAHIQSALLYLMNENHLDTHQFKLDKISSFSAIENVFPGDQIRIETYLKKQTDDSFTFNARSYVDGKEITVMLYHPNPTPLHLVHLFTQQHRFTLQQI